MVESHSVLMANCLPGPANKEPIDSITHRTILSSQQATALCLPPPCNRQCTHTHTHTHTHTLNILPTHTYTHRHTTTQTTPLHLLPVLPTLSLGGLHTPHFNVNISVLTGHLLKRICFGFFCYIFCFHFCKRGCVKYL